MIENLETLVKLVQIILSSIRQLLNPNTDIILPIFLFQS